MHLRTMEHNADFCVVGGGLAGMCAAIAAARRGLKTVLMHDRPVLGGNASSEIRMWVCGAHGENMRETGIIEEIELENIHRNPLKNFSLWDTVLYEKAKFQPNLTLLLNCSCIDCVMSDRRITSVSGWQLTAETTHRVNARFFADCSGDSILAPLSGAEFRMGREARAEFGESIEPEAADKRTMGMSLLLQARQTSSPQPFVAPQWAYRYDSDEQLPHRGHDLHNTNFWWIELGGTGHTIHDTEQVRDELLKVALGVWDHVKNRGDHGADNWVLEWLGFLPGKRESRRYVGDHLITQNDVESGGHFPDIVAYGGWSMDDHHPEGVNYSGKPTIFHPAPSPWGIPYRSLYSRNVKNLFCAGRNISATHIALSSSRVMRTCATLGQAVGTAAALASSKDCLPSELFPDHIDALQQALMDDDQYLPGKIRRVSPLCAAARLRSSSGDPEPLRSGVDRPFGGSSNCWQAAAGNWVEYAFESPVLLRSCRLVFDSNLNRHYRDHRQPFNYPLDRTPVQVAPELIRDFRIDVADGAGGWETLCRVNGNYQRLLRVDSERQTTAVRFVPESTWGAAFFRVFAWDIA